MKYFLKIFSLITLCLFIAFIFSAQSRTASQENSGDTIYKGKDARGRLVFSNKPLDDKSQKMDLPEIKKEDIDSKISRLKKLTPKNCLEHAGVDCTAGPDTDGSVICSDGYKEAVLRFQDKCTEALLRVENAEIKKTGRLNQLKLVLRNHSPVKAKNVRTEISLPKKKLKLAKGPTSVEPWGLAEYLLKDYGDETLSSNKVRYKVRCKNCQHTLKK